MILTQLRALTQDDFRDLPNKTAKIPEPTLKASLLIPAREASEGLTKTLTKASQFFEARFQDDFEIILIPNPAPDTPEAEVKELLARVEFLAERFTHVRVVPHISPPEAPGKGSALRTGFYASQGEMICFTDSDLPYDLTFFDQAFIRYSQGFDLITGNRRRPESLFDIPVSVLPFAYNRHRLGLLFNWTVRRFLPIGTTDTQAGIKVISRRLAEEAFSLQRCPGFFFDIELFLVCRALGFAQAEIPVSLHLDTEKSTVRIIRESILAVYWLWRIWVGQLSGYYGKKSNSTSEVLSRYSKVTSLSFGTRIFLFLRWILTPYSKMSAHLPPQGRIVDYGCGHGLLALVLAQKSKNRSVIGIDHDKRRIEIASQAGRGISNLEFSEGAGFHGQAKGISIIDVMHYFDRETQKKNLEQAFDQLEPNGVLIFREVDPQGGVVSSWNRFYEKVATSVGFTRSNEEKLYFRTREEWLELLRSIGFKARAERCSSVLFADVLYIGEKSAEAKR
jgi:glycosyltransferase involved in cell wall biosynthesis